MSDDKAGIEKLRDSLFAALAGLQNKTMDVHTAKAMSEVSQTIINTAKVELDFQNLNENTHHKSSFFKLEHGTTPTRHGVMKSNDGTHTHLIK